MAGFKKTERGRLVKCSNCKNTWFYKHKDEININISNIENEKIDENKFIGAAIRFGKGDVDLISSGGTELDNESLTLNLYGILPKDKERYINAVLGLSALKIDSLYFLSCV